MARSCVRIMTSILPFCKVLPKVELHAHINASVTPSIIQRVLSARSQSIDGGNKIQIIDGESTSLSSSFDMFKIIHKISDNTEAAYQIAHDVIEDFAKDNVKYLELRTTPRAVMETGMTKSSYVEAVLRAIEDCATEGVDVVVRLLLSINRTESLDVAMETVDLAEKYSKISNGTVVGIGLSGNPTIGDASLFVPVLQDAKKRGLKLALHIGEIPNINEIHQLLNVGPDRIGHGTCLHPEAGGTPEIVNWVQKHRIPIEACPTSNQKCETVPHFKDHHFKYWYDKGHPCVISTDGAGVFSTTLSREYSIVSETFHLTEDQLWTVSYNSINCIFAEDVIKQQLKKLWREFQTTSVNSV